MTSTSPEQVERSRAGGGDALDQIEDRVPGAARTQLLTGRLDAACLTTLRQMGGLQSYPSRSKDPDPVDDSTGSVGIGANGAHLGGGRPPVCRRIEGTAD